MTLRNRPPAPDQHATVPGATHTRRGFSPTAHDPGRAPQDAARLGRVRDPQGVPAQDRRPSRRKGRAHPHPLRVGLSGRRPVPAAGGAPRGLGPLTTVPRESEPLKPRTPTLTTSTPGEERRRTRTPVRSKSPDKVHPPRISRAKPRRRPTPDAYRRAPLSRKHSADSLRAKTEPRRSN